MEGKCKLPEGKKELEYENENIEATEGRCD